MSRSPCGGLSAGRDTEPRGAAAREAAHDATPEGERRGMWRIHYSHPGARPSPTAPPVVVAAECRPTVLARVVDSPRWHQLYRAGCLGCDHEGPERRRENVAVEDAHDHAWPGWRDLPAVRLPGSNHERWLAGVRKAYPAGWLEAGGPIITVRADTRLIRHLPGKAPGGGYDLAAGYCRPRKQRVPHDQTVWP